MKFSFFAECSVTYTSCFVNLHFNVVFKMSGFFQTAALRVFTVGFISTASLPRVLKREAGNLVVGYRVLL